MTVEWTLAATHLSKRRQESARGCRQDRCAGQQCRHHVGRRNRAFTSEQAKVIFDTNVIGSSRHRAVLPSMAQKRDSLIINIGSVLAA